MWTVGGQLNPVQPNVSIIVDVHIILHIRWTCLQFNKCALSEILNGRRKGAVWRLVRSSVFVLSTARDGAGQSGCGPPIREITK